MSGYEDLRDFEAEYMIVVTDYTDSEVYVIRIEKMGGGTYSQKYSGKWRYFVTCDGEEVMRGQDFESGMPMTHREVAQQVISFRTNDVTEHDFRHCLQEKYRTDDGVWVTL